jgi:parallel beta-helix repeat protein
MLLPFAAVLLALPVAGQGDAKATTLRPGLTVTRSPTIARDSTLRADAPATGGLITVKGKNIVVDFRNAVIRSGRDEIRARDTLEGTGILVEGSENVVLKNVNVQGFRFNIRVIDSKNVRVEGCEVGNSRAIRMMRGGRPVDTFLVLRDPNVWREYGAGIWIERSSGCRIERSRGAGGTIGAALVDSTACTVHDNDFSFCGGWGVGLARTKRSVVSWNRLDFVNRVWAGGWGGDSAAIGVADDCDENYFVGNSMTHGGDGFFLSNRNDIGPVDAATGFFAPQGGSDRNVIAYNDGSWSPANAFEGTFSIGNVYYRNVANDSGYGFWLGFSSESLLIENQIFRNRNDGIAIEHGRGTRVAGNHFADNGQSAIHLWASPQKERAPFPSTRIDIRGNTIERSPWAYRLEGSTDVAVTADRVTDARLPQFAFASREPADAVEAFRGTAACRRVEEIAKTKPKGFRSYAETGLPQGLEWVQPDEFGPRDFRGKPAHYRLVDPGTLEIRLIDSAATLQVSEWAELRKSPTRNSYLVTARTEDGAAGEERPVVVMVRGKGAMEIREILRTAVWDMSWYSWRGMTYEDRPAWNRLFASKPLLTQKSRILGGEWSGRAPAPGLPADHFALVATTRLRVTAGRYSVGTLSDDGIRVFVDGKLVIDRWNHHGATPDTAVVELTEGVHALRVEYCQESGGAVLRVDWNRA